VNVTQLVTVDRSQLASRIGALSPARVREILAGLHLLLEPRKPIEAVRRSSLSEYDLPDRWPGHIPQSNPVQPTFLVGTRPLGRGAASEVPSGRRDRSTRSNPNETALCPTIGMRLVSGVAFSG